MESAVTSVACENISENKRQQISSFFFLLRKTSTETRDSSEYFDVQLFFFRITKVVHLYTKYILCVISFRKKNEMLPEIEKRYEKKKTPG